MTTARHKRSSPNRMSGSGWSRALILVLLAGAAPLSGCSDGGDPAKASKEAWPTYGGSLARTFSNPEETAITRETVGKLIPKWRFPTPAVVTAQPVVSDVERPGEGPTRLVFVLSWDGYLYALRAADGSRAWSFRVKPHPGGDYPYASSGAIAEIDGRKLLFVGANMTMYCLDAATGELVWSFDAGDGCTDCDRLAERNQIETSPAVFEEVVYFGMDVNENRVQKGGVFAVDARSGTLVWYFDPETVATCRPVPGDDVRRFDGYHSAAELGLPEDFFATRPGCDFDRTGHGCGGIWSSPTIDTDRRMIYLDSANCGAYVPGPDGTGVMPPYGEAIFALSLDGSPAWHWQPRQVDQLDLDFGATPNLFEAEIGGDMREVVGVGGKDGTYYVLDRDGVNEITGRVEPYWQTNVVAGGPEGGMIGSPAVGEGGVFFATAPGFDVFDPQRPTVHALDWNDGSVRWQVPDAAPSFGPTTFIPGIAFTGGVFGQLVAWDAETGAQLAALSTGGALSSAPSVVDGELYVGAGTGTRDAPPESVAFITSWIPNTVNAFCVAGSEGCPEEGRCIDFKSCTLDTLEPGGECSHVAAPDGTSCTVGMNAGQCQSGECRFAELDCDDSNQCTRERATPEGCKFESLPPDTPCTSRGRSGACRDGLCFPDPG